jgi:trehalose 6-phosphate phosphatase
VPAASDSWAVFLDVDGTLIEFAPTPDTVHVSPELPLLLEKVRRRFQGALALVSGRSLADLDALFQPFRFPAAGIHGVERRDAAGELHWMGLTPQQLQQARKFLSDFVAEHPGLLLEDKGRSLAVHFRLAPHLEHQVRAAVAEVMEVLPPGTHVQSGHYVLEIKSDAATKHTAIAQFMQEPPFAGRVPVFVGDDVTDMDGFQYVESVGGHAVFVGPEPDPARGWLPDPRAVREWLRGLVQESPEEGQLP